MGARDFETDTHTHIYIYIYSTVTALRCVSGCAWRLLPRAGTSRCLVGRIGLRRIAFVVLSQVADATTLREKEAAEYAKQACVVCSLCQLGPFTYQSL